VFFALAVAFGFSYPKDFLSVSVPPWWIFSFQAPRFRARATTLPGNDRPGFTK
jgi:hypothetical protein